MATTSLEAPTLIGVLVADSNQMRCQPLVGALRRRPELQITACVLDPDLVLNAANSLPIHVATLNADNPRDGWPDLTIVRRLHLAHPEVAKIVLLDTYDRDTVVTAFRSGARGLFLFLAISFSAALQLHPERAPGTGVGQQRADAISH
jgi:DNA-binding NarL/FixJ family response regulator